MKRYGVFFLLAMVGFSLHCGLLNNGSNDSYYIYFAHQNPNAPASAIEYPIFRMKTDGSESDTARFGSALVYSEQGVRIDTAGEWMAFAEAAGVFALAVQKTDGSGKFVYYGGAVDFMPNISRDGKTVAFVEIETQVPEHQYLCLINNDSTGLEKFTVPPEGRVADEWPAFSPDGQKVIFAEHFGTSRADLWTVKPDRSGKTQLTDVDSLNTEPSYSPDGTKNVFVSNRTGAKQIYVMNADGSQQSQLTTAGSNYNPCFSPDGKKVAFVSERDGSPEIYIMDAEGTNQQRLTNNTVNDYWPVFSAKKF
jgi:Tol biopolymer transport system component